MPDRPLLPRLRDAVRHAFALPSDEPLAADDLARLDRLADAIARRRMQTPAILALESSRPLGGIAANAAHAIAPLLRGIVPPEELDAAARLLQHPRAIDELVGRLQAVSRDGNDKA